MFCEFCRKKINNNVRYVKCSDGDMIAVCDGCADYLEWFEETVKNNKRINAGDDNVVRRSHK